MKKKKNGRKETDNWKKTKQQYQKVLKNKGIFLQWMI